jgi:hypothetical protein
MYEGDCVQRFRAETTVCSGKEDFYTDYEYLKNHTLFVSLYFSLVCVLVCCRHVAAVGGGNLRCIRRNLGETLVDALCVTFY